jgi:PAS domain S-box-containing protein
MRSLVVDDNKENCYLLEIILKSVGFEVLSSFNGAEALEKLRVRQFDLIISDIMMPVMDGFQLCRRCKQDINLKDIPFIFYTATYTDLKDEELGMKLGADKFIRKPTEPAEFVKQIQEVLKNFKEGKIAEKKTVEVEEKETLKLYSERLVNKLESKIFQLEKANAEIQRTQEALTEANEKLRLIFESVADGIMVIDMNGHIVDMNNTLLGMLGSSNREDFLGRNWFDIVAIQKKTGEENLSNSIASGGTKDVEYSVKRVDGSKFPGEMSLSVLGPDNILKMTGYVAIIKDITERKKMENQIIVLYEKEKQQRVEMQEEVQARGMFINILAHELRTPLTPILASTGILNDCHKDLPVEIEKKLISNVSAGVQVLCTRLDELLELARHSRGTFILNYQSVNLNKFLNQVISRYKPSIDQEGQELKVEIAESLPAAEIDSSRLEQVIVNLLSNASKFSLNKKRIYFRASVKNSELFVEVEDNGMGISAEERVRIFQPYHRVEQDRLKFPGLGLGLAISKIIIEAHGGKIWLDSEKGNGSKFYFTIPIKKPVENSNSYSGMINKVPQTNIN